MKPHRTDMLSLVSAIIFLAIFGWWMFTKIVDVHVPDGGWWVAFSLILLGLLGLVGAIRSIRHANATQPPVVHADPGPSIDPVPAMVGEPTADLGEPVSSPPRGESRD